MRHHETVGRKKARALITRTGHHLGRAGGHFADGGRSDYEQDKRMVEKGVHEHERKMHPGEKETKLRLADGGVADGDAAPERADRGSRGKGKGKQTHIAIVVNPGAGAVGGAGAPGRPVPVPVPVHAPPPAAAAPPPPMMAPPPRPMPPPPGPAMGGMPPGGAPMMRKDGGSTRGHPHMTAGQGSGEGRLEQSRQLDYCEGGRS